MKISYLTPKIKKDIKKHALSLKNEEICGLIVLKDFEYIYVSCENIALDKTKFFILNPEDYLKASELGIIQANVHSHPNGNIFSEFDKINSNNFNLTYILYHIEKDQFFQYTPGEEQNKYIGRNFEIGKNDCFSLLEEFYIDKFGFMFNKFDKLNKRTENWDKELVNIFDEMMEFNPQFFEVTEGPRKYGDINIYNITGKPDHFAVYLGDDMILHQKLNKFSTIEKEDSLYKKHLYKTIRLK